MATDDELRQQHKALAETILEHRERYYVDDSPTVSDAEYDRLVRELEQVEEQLPELRTLSVERTRSGALTLSLRYRSTACAACW